MFAGRFIQKNNINFFIDAFLTMRDKTFNLGLIGEGPLKPLIEQRLKALKTQRIKIIDKLIGTELIKRIHTLRPHIPVILFSGREQETEITHGSDLQINAFIHKPVFREDLYRTVRKVLKNAGRSCFKHME